MAFQKMGIQDKSYIADSLEDLNKLPSSNMGSTCWVIETAEKYMVNSQGKWILQTLSTNGKSDHPINPDGSIDLSMFATKEEMNKKDEEILAHSNALDEIIFDKLDDIQPESTAWNEIK